MYLQSDFSWANKKTCELIVQQRIYAVKRKFHIDADIYYVMSPSSKKIIMVTI